MAICVVLKFEDDTIAAKFVQGHDLSTIVHSDVVAAYKFPTLICPADHANMKKQAWSRGVKWGWWLCDECGRPSRGQMEKFFEDGIDANEVLESYLMTLDS